MDEETGRIVKSSAETFIVIPMMDAVAEDVLDHQRDSLYVSKSGRVAKLLKDLAVVQGYTSAEFATAERVG